MGSGFIQRLKAPASTDFYKSIEGVYIIDQGGPAFVKGQGTGRVAIVGEFADMLYAVAVDASGNVTSRPQPVQIFGADDLVAKLGDFDSTLGDIGGAGGNGFLDIDGCAFTELVAVPVNLCSSKGVRVWRALPTNRSATDPSPVVPISAGTVAAGREFRSGSNRVKLGTRVLFKQRDAYLFGIDGSVTAVAGSATAGSVTSAAGPFVIRPGYVTHISINQGANQVWTWGGTAAKCKMAAAGAYVGGVSGTFDIQWADESGSHNNTITIDGTVAAGELALLARLNEQLFNAGVPVFAEDSADANKLRFVAIRYGTSTHVEITAVTGAGFTADTGIDVTAQTTAPLVTLTKTGGTGGKNVTVAFLDAATATEVDAAIALADDVTGGSLTHTAGTTGTLTLTTSSTGASPNGVQVKSTSTARLGFDTTEHNGTAAGAGGGTSLTFSAAGGGFVANGVAEGDIIVIGVIDAAGAQGSNAGTYRVKSVDGATDLTVEKLDGTSFNWTTGASLAWRIHLWDVADSGKDHQFSEAGGYLIPARPLDATITAGTVLSPTVAPDALTSSSADALSGLGAAVHPSGNLVYTSSVQAMNVTGTGLNTLYTDAINALLGEDDPQAGVDIAFASRSTQAIEVAGKAMTLLSYAHGHGRVWIQAPALSTIDPITVAGDSYPGAGFQRDESVIETWPGVNVFQRKAVNVRCKGADGNTYTDGNLDLSGKGNLASVLSLLLPERNPGEATDTTALGLARVQGYQRGITTTLNMDVYKLFKSKGVCALKWTKVNGASRAVYQSGVTTSLTAGEEGIGRRRLANYIQDSIAEALDPLAKQPISPDLREKALMLQFNFLNGLLSPENPKLARIAGFEVTVGNDPTMEEQDILVTGHKVRKFGDANAIVLTSEIGENVTVSATTGG